MARQRRGRPLDGILVLDKPAGLSSNRALQMVKRLYGAAKAGHTGSLDPLATGLLPICFGEATKLSAFLLDADKHYRVRVRLGETTTTADAEGEVSGPDVFLSYGSDDVDLARELVNRSMVAPQRGRHSARILDDDSSGWSSF